MWKSVLPLRSRILPSLRQARPISRRRRTAHRKHVRAPVTWAEQFENFERINSMRETNCSFDSCYSCKRLVPSRSHELHEPKPQFVSRIAFISSNLSNLSAHVSGIRDPADAPPNKACSSSPACPNKRCVGTDASSIPNHYRSRAWLRRRWPSSDGPGRFRSVPNGFGITGITTYPCKMQPHHTIGVNLYTFRQ